MLKQKRFELETELKLLKWKQQQSAWYERKTNLLILILTCWASLLVNKSPEQLHILCSTSSSCSRSSTPSLEFMFGVSPGPISPEPFFSPQLPKRIQSHVPFLLKYHLLALWVVLSQWVRWRVAFSVRSPWVVSNPNRPFDVQLHSLSLPLDSQTLSLASGHSGALSSTPILLASGDLHAFSPVPVSLAPPH